MLTNVNKYIKKQIGKLTPKNREELINFATFLGKQKGEVKLNGCK